MHIQISMLHIPGELKGYLRIKFFFFLTICHFKIYSLTLEHECNVKIPRIGFSG